MSSRIKLPFKLGDSKKVNEYEINETSKKEDFSLSEVRKTFFTKKIFFFLNYQIVRYGFPYKPTTIAYDPVQKILAIGTKNGIIKM